MPISKPILFSKYVNLQYKKLLYIIGLQYQNLLYNLKDLFLRLTAGPSILLSSVIGDYHYSRLFLSW